MYRPSSRWSKPIFLFEGLSSASPEKCNEFLGQAAGWLMGAAANAPPIRCRLYFYTKTTDVPDMQRLFLVVASSLALCALPVSAPAATRSAAPADGPASSAPPPIGQQIAQTISLITGVAISPLLGMSAVGAWTYLKAPPERRPHLPWFANPWFWMLALLLVALCFAKDTVGTAAPSILKKPFDAAETVEHKISGLIAAGLFVPIAAAIFQAPGAEGASLSGTGLAMIDLHWLGNALLVPVALAAFVVVFLASTAINILILLSPFTTVDAALKGFRLAVLGSVAVSAWANPWVGAAWALVIIVIAWFIAGWSFRMFHFGSAYLWDFFTLRRHRFQPDPSGNWLFLARRLGKVPVRTYGRLVRDAQGGFVLGYRPWLIFPERTLPLPSGPYAVGRGLIHSEVVELEGDATRSLLTLPPRYRSHEAEIVRIYGFVGVRPAGLRAALCWFRSALGFRPKRQPALA